MGTPTKEQSQPKAHRLLKGSQKIKQPALAAKDPDGVQVSIGVVANIIASNKAKDGKKTTETVVVKKGDWTSNPFPAFNRQVNELFQICVACSGIPEKIAEFADVLHRPVYVVKEKNKVVVVKPSTGYKSKPVEPADFSKTGTLISKNWDGRGNIDRDNPGARELLNFQLTSTSPNAEDFDATEYFNRKKAA